MSDTKTLFLVRHAKSSWKDADIDDIDRPLNKRGLRDAPKMGKYLAGFETKPDVIISSPAVRAFTTAKLIWHELGYESSKIKTEKRFYTFDSQSLLRAIQKISNKFQVVMVVGHNPAITVLVNQLTNSNINNVPTCGVAILGFPISGWKEVKNEKGELIEYFYPKKLW